MNLAFAFAGFRHPHIFSLYERVKKTPGAEIVSCAENDPEFRKNAEAKGVAFTHDTVQNMLEDSSANIVAIGDAYALRGKISLAALEHGFHVLSDKPLCVSRAELTALRNAAKKSERKIGCMLDLRTEPNMLAARHAVRTGRIGEIRAVQFSGQHPLNYGTRAKWYFEPGMHGGTINDLAVHALDCVPFLTNLNISKLLFAHAKNCEFPEMPFFQTTAQLAFELENGAGVSGDVSYALPKFDSPTYWRFTVSGTKGLLDFNYGTPGVTLIRNGGKSETLFFDPDFMTFPDYFDMFLADLRNEKTSFGTKEILQTAEKTLILQEIANSIP